MTLTDTTVTRTDLAEALAHMNAHCKRQPCIVDPTNCPTAWDKAHVKLNGLITAWEQARA